MSEQGSISDLLVIVHAKQYRCSSGLLSDRQVTLFKACIAAAKKLLRKQRRNAHCILSAELAGRARWGDYRRAQIGTGYTGPYTAVKYDNDKFELERIPAEHTWTPAFGQLHNAGVTLRLAIWDQLNTPLFDVSAPSFENAWTSEASHASRRSLHRTPITRYRLFSKFQNGISFSGAAHA